MADETPARQTESEDEEARRQRQRAPADIARGNVSDATATSAAPSPVASGDAVLPAARSTRRRLWRAALAVVLVVAVLGGVGYYALHRPASPAGSTGHPRLIDLAQDGLSCLKDAVWLPDGSTLILRSGELGVVATDAGQMPSTGDLASQHLDSTPVFPLRDKGLAQGLVGVIHSRPGSDTDPIPVLWRPDGRVVVVVTQANATPDNSTPPAPSVRLYNCATGRLIGSVSEPSATTNSGGQPLASWSPDGTHLLLLDSTNVDVTIWGPGQLPRG